MMGKKDILLAYYGDDFTGSSDVMEVLSLMGIPTVLFLEAPTSREVENFIFKNKFLQTGKQRAFGVAGIARTMNPKEMEKELDSVFQKISYIPFRYFHYKICSTLDSSPETGNIGVALDIAEKYFLSRFIPLVLGFPVLNRFVVFGNLFARIKETVYRLDRHPVMSRHPVTPMDESDIQLHLHKQTRRNILLVDVLQLKLLEKRTVADFFPEGVQVKKAPLLLFDTLENGHLESIGDWLHRNCQQQHQLLLGSSALEFALGSQFRKERKVSLSPRAVNPVLILSGSCAQATADQIEYAGGLGFHLIRLDVAKLATSAGLGGEMNRVIGEALQTLRENKNTVVFSALGADDPLVNTQWLKAGASAQTIGSCQAKICKMIIEKFPLKRLVTAGGDTSGYILKELGIKALEFTNVLAPGSPLCTAHAEDPRIDGLEIAIKGGQNGTVRYLEFAQQGGIVP